MRDLFIEGLHLRASRWPLDPDRPTLLCVHGAGGDTATWTPLAPYVDDQADFVAVDLPGHGANQGPAPATVAALAHAVARLLPTLDAGPLVPCGLSLGGAVVLQLLLDHGTHRDVAGLSATAADAAGLGAAVLVSTGARLRVLPAIFDAIDQDFPAAVDATLHTATAPGVDPAGLTEVRTAMLANGPAVTARGFLACDRFDVRSRLVELDLPVLIVSADHDLLTPPRYADHLHQHITGSHRARIADAGHLCTVEQPAAVARAITGFLAEVVGG